MEEKIFKNDAKQIVDLAFNSKLFKDDLTRDDFNSFEDLIQFLLQSRFDNIKKAEAFFDDISKRRAEKVIEVDYELLKKSMEVIDDYLNAGYKELRTKAHEKAKVLYKKYYGVDYVNRDNRNNP